MIHMKCRRTDTGNNTTLAGKFHFFGTFILYKVCDLFSFYSPCFQDNAVCSTSSVKVFTASARFTLLCTSSWVSVL